MATQKEIVSQLQETVATINKIGNETDVLIQRVKALQDAVDAQDNASQELVDAANAVAAQLKIVDDKVPDTLPTPSV